MSTKVINSNNLKSEVKKLLSDNLGTKNPFSIPSIDRVSINVGVGKFQTENNKKQAVYNLILKLTGQKPKKIFSKKSIAGFKLRRGDFIGINTTLRGQKAYDFITMLIHLALPRSRDFHGIKPAFDKDFKSFSLGLKTSQIFPPIGFDSEVDFGMQVNIIFTNATKDNYKLLEFLGTPFEKKVIN